MEKDISSDALTNYLLNIPQRRDLTAYEILNTFQLSISSRIKFHHERIDALEKLNEWALELAANTNDEVKETFESLIMQLSNLHIAQEEQIAIVENAEELSNSEIITLSNGQTIKIDTNSGRILKLLAYNKTLGGLVDEDILVKIYFPLRVVKKGEEKVSKVRSRRIRARSLNLLMSEINNLNENILTEFGYKIILIRMLSKNYYYLEDTSKS